MTPEEARRFKSDKLWNYEVGAKTSWRGPAPGYQSPTVYHGTHSPPRNAGAYAQWPGVQYAAHPPRG